MAKEKNPVGHPPNPPEYKTLQIRGVPPELYKELQEYCRKKIKEFKNKWINVLHILKRVVYLYNKIKQIEIMTTQEKIENLKAKRAGIITELNKYNAVKNNEVTLVEAMTMLKDFYLANEGSSLLPAYSHLDAILGAGSKSISVTFTKPYSESNHAKQVAYFGADKMKSFKNNL